LAEVVRFRARWSPLVTIVTVGAVMVFVLAIGAAGWRVPWVGGLLIAILVLTMLFAPRGYVVGARTLTIERRLLPIRIPLSEIRKVEELDRERLRGSIRVFGSGGLFGIYGRFWSRKLGHFRMHATRGGDYVLIDAGVRYVVTPSTPADFVRAIQKARGIPATS
jgi:hypothetical protein